MAGHSRKQRLFEYGELQTIISSKLRGVKRLSIHKFEVKETEDFRPVILRGGSKHIDGTLFDLDWESIMALDEYRKDFRREMVLLNDGWAWSWFPRNGRGYTTERWIQMGKLWTWNGIQETKLVSVS